jgi:hypothetical protein
MSTSSLQQHQQQQQDNLIADEIAREERLIQIYSAELALLRRQLQQQQQDDAQWNNNPMDSRNTSTITDDTDDPLRWILNEPEAYDEPDAAAIDKLSRMHIYQGVFRGIQYTNVERISANEYLLRGLFADNPAVGFVLRVSFEQCISETDKKHQLQQQQKQLIVVEKKEYQVSNLECRLVDASVAESDALTVTDWTWLQRQAQSHIDPLHIPLWLETVRAYLQFDKRRRAFLNQHKIAHSVEADSRVQCHLQLETNDSRCDTDLDLPSDKYEPLDENTHTSDSVNHPRASRHIDHSLATQSSFALSLFWSWQWDTKTGALELAESARRAGFQQAHLTALVQLYDSSCERAIVSILQCCCSMRSLNFDTNSDKDESDNDDDTSPVPKGTLSEYYTMLRQKQERKRKSMEE